MIPIDVDPPHIVRDMDGRVIPLEESTAYLQRSRDAWMKAARFARHCMDEGIEVDFYRYQVSVRVELARAVNHKLLAVSRHRKAIGYQGALL